MKRLGKGTFEAIVDINNLRQAHINASKGKQHYTEVKEVEQDLAGNLQVLQDLLISGEFSTGTYTEIERIEGGKLRKLSVLPYFPDRVVQHALLLVIGPRLERSLIRDTFQSLKGRGTSDNRRRVVSFIKKNKPTHFLQIDIHKYYPSIDNSILKKIVLRFVKCTRTLAVLYDIIDSRKGLPIGNYTSQILGNLYLSAVDWFVKQKLRVKGYFRYCDDLIFLANCSRELHNIRKELCRIVREYGLKIKDCWVVSTLSKGLDYIGYVFFGTGIRLRKKIYKRAKKLQTCAIPSYFGWLLPTKDNYLRRKYANILKREKRSV